MSDLLETAFASVDAELDRSVESLFALVRVPSVSSDPAYAGDCRDAATMLSHMLEGLGFSASVRETAGHPCVIAHLPSKKAGVPKVLFYGHYDVQPAEPFETWQSPPFDPVRVERDGATSLVGRGMADDKGQMWTFFQACQALLRTTGELPVDLTVLVEGEEEAGSASLEQFLRENRDELACDVAFVCDSSMWDEVTPAITCSLKGLLHERVTLIGPNQDLHSGLYGGVATNPLRVMARVLSALHDADGKVAIPGFYDGVREVAPTVLGRWRELEFSAWDVLSGVGLSHSAGEAGRTVLEQLWARPAIDINGINGGNAGPGERSVLPSVATARLSIRLVDGQDPQRIRALFREFISRSFPRTAPFLLREAKDIRR
jgi:acetylornithine deacetylase/succinyl-diaminopimelate desuccinylase-like protein